jgi:hypothetical protein
MPNRRGRAYGARIAAKEPGVRSHRIPGVARRLAAERGGSTQTTVGRRSTDIVTYCKHCNCEWNRCPPQPNRRRPQQKTCLWNNSRTCSDYKDYVKWRRPLTLYRATGLHWNAIADCSITVHAADQPTLLTEFAQRQWTAFVEPLTGCRFIIPPQYNNVVYLVCNHVMLVYQT